MTDLADSRQSSQSAAIRGTAIRPHHPAARGHSAGRREFSVIVAAGVAISAWALFPSAVETGIYVPLPETSAGARADSATEGNGAPVNDYMLANAKQVPSAQPSNQPQYVTVRYSSSAVDVSLVPLRSKLQALLMLLRSSLDEQDSWVLAAKLEALLKLPDAVLAELIQHPDLADLRKKLDAVFLGSSDLAGVATELDRISVTSVGSEEAERIDVVAIDGKPAYAVQATTDGNATMNADGSTVAALSPSGQPVMVRVLSRFNAPAGLRAFSFSLAPFRKPPPPAPAPAPTYEMRSAFAPAFASAPSDEAPAPPSASSIPSSSPEPADTRQTMSSDVMTSGNKFEPGETAATADDGDSAATQAEVPSPSPTEPEGPVGMGGGDPVDPSNTEGGTSSPSPGEPSP